MKLTQALWRQHIGRMTKRHWWVQGQRRIIDTPAETILISKGVKIVDIKDAVVPKLERQNIDLSHLEAKPPALDETNPNWNERPRLKYSANSLLITGIEQAQMLTKSDYITNALPEKVQTPVEISDPNIDKTVQRLIRSSHLFDACQEKLPKLKDPLRPAWNFARVYGIPDVRKFHNIVQKLLQICELMCDPMMVRQRKLINDGHVRTYVERDNDLLYLEANIDTMILSNKLLTSLRRPDEVSDTPLPDLYPLLPTISLEPENIYTVTDHYPVPADSPWMNPHTIFVNYDSQLVKNKSERPVQESQILARSLMASFTTAACCAKLKFGEGILDLPEPITIQCVHSNSKWFQFSVFQLNTLDIAREEGKRNVWWSLPLIDLFDQAEYVQGQPILENYNPEVFRRILTFYKNV